MGEIIWWEKFDEPKKLKVQLASVLFEQEVNGQYCCSDDRAERVNFYGGLSPDPSKTEIDVNFVAVFKNDSVHYLKIKLPATQDEMIEQAEHYLKSIE